MCIRDRDLGFLTPEVQQLVIDSGFPGMKVLEFAFDPREPSNYLPDRYPENAICYTCLLYTSQPDWHVRHEPGRSGYDPHLLRR